MSAQLTFLESCFARKQEAADRALRGLESFKSSSECVDAYAAKTLGTATDAHKASFKRLREYEDALKRADNDAVSASKALTDALALSKPASVTNIIQGASSSSIVKYPFPPEDSDVPFDWKREGKVDSTCLDQWERTKKHWMIYSEQVDSLALLGKRDTREAMDGEEVQRRMDVVSKLASEGKRLCTHQSTVFQIACKDGWPVANIFSGKRQVVLSEEQEVLVRKARKQAKRERTERDEKSAKLLKSKVRPAALAHARDKDPKTFTPRAMPDKRDIQCRKCNRFGHYANECTNPPRKN
jgi:hypothetical protein